MTSINQFIDTVTRAQTACPRFTPMAWGEPGVAKSASARVIAKNQNIPEDRYMDVNLVNHEVVDFNGIPRINDSGSAPVTEFIPTDIFAKFRKGTGPGFINIEELPQSERSHQTWTAGFIWDRKTATFDLDPEVRIMCTGNRVQDRSGAKALLAHLNNRVYHYDIEVDTEAALVWMLDNGVDPMVVAFLRLRRDLVQKFDPDARASPTCRAWTQFGTEVPRDLPRDLYLMTAIGKLGEGAAVELVAALDMMHKMPNIDEIRARPADVEVPSEPSVRYAVATCMSMSTTPDLFAADVQYISRMPAEFQMVYVYDATRLNPDLAASPDYIKWAVANQNTFMGA